MVNKMTFQGIYKRIRKIIENAHIKIIRAVNYEMVQAYWLIGHEIVKEEQKGKKRAEYGRQLVEMLSKYLINKYGSGWSPSQLWHIRQFYLIYKDHIPQILYPMYPELNRNKNLHTLSAELSWSHYRVLMRIENQFSRNFYEVECINNKWSVRELER